MDEVERLALEREVQMHLEHVEQLLARLRELEDGPGKQDPVPKEVASEIKGIRIELRGRMAAIAMGESRLGVDPF